MIVLLIYLLVMLIIIKSCIVVVKQNEVYVIERLGRFEKIAEPGLTFIFPFIDRIRAKVIMSDQTLEFTSEDIVSKDKKVINMKIAISYTITDPMKVTYEVKDFKTSLEYTVEATITGEISHILYNDIYLEKAYLIENIRKQLKMTEESWGFEIKNISINDINLKFK